MTAQTHRRLLRAAALRHLSCAIAATVGCGLSTLLWTGPGALDIALVGMGTAFYAAAGGCLLQSRSGKRLEFPRPRVAPTLRQAVWASTAACASPPILLATLLPVDLPPSPGSTIQGAALLLAACVAGALTAISIDAMAVDRQ